MFAQYIATSGQNRADWAARLGIGRPYLSDLLNGKKTPSLDLAKKIERATGGAVPATSWIAEDADPVQIDLPDKVAIPAHPDTPDEAAA